MKRSLSSFHQPFVNGSPSERVYNTFHVREIINQKIGLMLCKFIATRSAGSDRDGARAKRFSTGAVARRVADNVDLGRGELAAMFFFCPGASESAKLVAIAVVVGKRAKFKKMPDPVVLQFQARSARDISREQRKHYVRPRLEPFKQLEHAGK